MKPEDIDYRMVVDAAPALIFSARPDGYIDYFNRRWLEYLEGVPLEALEGWGWTKFIHPEDLEEHTRLWRAAMVDGRVPVSQARVANSKGEYRWMLHRTEPVRDGAGNIVRWFGSSIDIEALKRAEHELHDLKEQLYRENIALKDEIVRTSMFEEIVGNSAALQRVLGLVTKVAGTDSTVLVTGETGTGKELVARAIHKASPRAVQRRLGRFELAEGGTIFLDEAGELPPETQVALLRVLQERTFERVGGTRPIPLDVRVIAATNRDLDKAIAQGSFRLDLFYRLSVFPIEIPPLRERTEDIPLLVDYLAQKYAARAGKRITAISRRTIDLLTAYDWPGNIRELQNVIQRAVILSEDTLAVDESWLPRKPGRATGAVRILGRPSASEETSLIEAALAGCKGRVAGADGAAAKLGVPRSTLESRIRALQIDKSRFRST